MRELLNPYGNLGKDISEKTKPLLTAIESLCNTYFSKMTPIEIRVITSFIIELVSAASAENILLKSIEMLRGEKNG